MALWSDGTGEGSSAASAAADEEGLNVDDEEEYEEAEGGNRLLGLMFGNVDNSGDHDVDYLDEDTFEELSLDQGSIWFSDESGQNVQN